MNDNIMYTRICPVCKRDTPCKNRKSYLAKTRLNKQCKSCSNKKNEIRRKEKERKIWEPIVGYWPLKRKTLYMIKCHWRSLTDVEKIEILLKNTLQKKYYWGHLRRLNRNAAHRKCRETIAIKYSGENHWMKRPEVLAKVKKSCEKYRGDNHWFRRDKNKV